VPPDELREWVLGRATAGDAIPLPRTAPMPRTVETEHAA
jgi:hypothetical protein